MLITGTICSPLVKVLTANKHKYYNDVITESCLTDAGSKDVSREENERVEVAELLDSCQEPSCSSHWLHVPLLHIIDIIEVHQGDGVSSFVRIQHCLFRLLRSLQHKEESLTKI